MSDPAPDLALLQRWMSLVVTHKKNAVTGARSAKGRALIPFPWVRSGKVVLPNERMSVTERLQVYNGGYFTRLKEVIEGDHPALVAVLGEQEFIRLMLDFVERYPSHHPNLNRFAKELPEFLAARKKLDHRAFLRDLARLGVAMADAFDAPEFTPADVEELASLTPEQWEQVVFEPNPSLQLLQTEYPVNEFFQQHLEDKNPTVPGRKRSYTALYRKDDRVWRLSLPGPAFKVLSTLCSGTPMGRALEQGRGLGTGIGRWFQEWSADGLFISLTTGL